MVLMKCIKWVFLALTSLLAVELMVLMKCIKIYYNGGID